MHRPHLLPLFLLLALTGCALFPQQHKPRPKHDAAIKSEQAERFLENLALAEIALEKNGAKAAAVKTQVKALNESGKGKKSPTTLTVTAVVLEYPGEKLLAPIGGKSRFQPLQKIQQKYAGMNKERLRNIKAGNVNVTLPSAIRFSSEDGIALKDQLETAKERIIATAQPLPAYENAQMQVQLARLFIQSRQRDAAYIAMENAKDALAAIAERSPQTDIKSLTAETEALEQRLHKELPYRI